MSHHAPPANGGIPGEYVVGSGTINPAALNAPAVLPPTASSLSDAVPRGVKRSRSEEVQEVYGGDDDDSKPRKRGRPPKTSKVSESPISGSQSLPRPASQAVQTPHTIPQIGPRASPSHASPIKAASKGPVIKALPTVRDHTTDQLNPEGDEFVPREFDDSGEKKVQPNGALNDGRIYRCRTFWVPGRGEKLFMLATECARVLGYRDSYLLFNKNRSLHKIIANQAEKDTLIAQDILPYSYRSRQIAIVTARSMFRQFGSRVIQNGRRVRDDYWEAKARKQGFTEDDPAGEKRPGGARQRAALEAAGGAIPLPQHRVFYDDQNKGAVTSSPYPVYDAVDLKSETRNLDYGGVQQARQTYLTQTFQERSASSNMDMLSQASSASEYNRNLEQQRVARSKYLEDIWHRPHEAPADEPQETTNATAVATQALQSPHTSATVGRQPPAMSHPQQVQNPMMAQAYSQHPGPSSMMAQSPVRMQAPMGVPQRSPSVPTPQQPGYGYQQGQMWPPNQPQPSPMAQHHPGMQYGQHMTAQSPHMQHSPMHAPTQMHHPQGSMHGPAMGYQGMQSPAYANMQQRQIYQPSPSPQQYMQSAAGTQPGMQSWPQGPQQQGQGGQPGWQF